MKTSSPGLHDREGVEICKFLAADLSKTERELVWAPVHSSSGLGVAQRRNHRPIEIDDKGLN